MECSPPPLTVSPRSPPETLYLGSPTIHYFQPDFMGSHQKFSDFYGQSCATSSSIMDAQNSLPPQDTATPHGLSARTMPQHLPALSLPNILSAEYDPFANYEPNPTSHYSHDAYTSQPSQGSIVSNDSSVARTPCRSPDPVGRYGHPYPRMATPTSQTKAEGVFDYARASAASQYPSPRSSHAVPTGSNNYACDIVNRGYLTELSSTTWSRSEYLPLEPDHPPTGTGGLGPALLPGGRRTRAQRSQKKTRKCTTKEDANFICEVEGCGKLFSRSYNYKAHKETHDEKREYPFPCTVPGCKKKFVRKTDLQRHNQSVHMKERNHGCDYCGRMFARKDTLRRHMEDGCSKRFDIGILDLRSRSKSPTRNSVYLSHMPLCDRQMRT